MARKQDRFAKSASAQVVVNGHAIRVPSSLDRGILERSIAMLDRRIAEDYWHPYPSKEVYVRSLSSGSRNTFMPALLRAKGLI